MLQAVGLGSPSGWAHAVLQTQHSAVGRTGVRSASMCWHRQDWEPKGNAGKFPQFHFSHVWLLCFPQLFHLLLWLNHKTSARKDGPGLFQERLFCKDTPTAGGLRRQPGLILNSGLSTSAVRAWGTSSCWYPLSQPASASSQQGESEGGVTNSWALTNHKPENFSPVPALSLVMSSWAGQFPLERHLFLIKALKSFWYKNSLSEEKWMMWENKNYSPGFCGAFLWQIPHSVTDNEQEYSTPLFATTAAMQERWVHGGGLEATRTCLSLNTNGKGITFFSI